MKERILIYQVLPRLFGNMRKDCRPNGTIEQNGCGKMNDFTKERLCSIRQMGFTHVWYTGLLEHATQTDYSAYGIAKDYPSVVKGKAGSPYAIKDYYDIDPDLAEDVNERLSEFEALLRRSHEAGLKVIMDFVPNHVARRYQSDQKPEGVSDLGEGDDTNLAFSPQNNFYYLPGCAFRSPIAGEDDTHPYEEMPAKATGNDAFTASPGINDWYETVKLNYGIDYQNWRSAYFEPIPDTWQKMTAILCHWASKGVDAFRCDMAEMVPCAFWAWAIPRVKEAFPHVVFIAEVYDPSQYSNYTLIGKFDYLYDKVGLYDTLRGVMTGCRPTSDITPCWQQVDNIREHMLYFLENHDEQRIASDFFAGNAVKGLPAMLVLACMGNNPVMVYFGQELGERGMDAEGFSGRDGRTTIFDYWSVPSVRNWLEKGTEGLDADTKALRDGYVRLLTLCNAEKSLREGAFFDLMYANYENEAFNSATCYTFLRKQDDDLMLVCAHFGDVPTEAEVRIPQHAFDCMQIAPGMYEAEDLLSGEKQDVLLMAEKNIPLRLPANGGVLLKIRLASM